MKLAKSAWKFLKPNELTFIIGGVFAVISIITCVSLYRGDDKSFNGKLKYENLSPEKKKQIQALTENLQLGNDDKNVRYADRVRDASSIGLGFSLYLVNERIAKNRVLTLDEAMKEFSKCDLLPPGVSVLFPQSPVSFGLIQTAHGLFYIRYSAKPLRIEILSGTANGQSDGSFFILRVPDTSAANMKPEADSAKTKSAGAWATLFESPATADGYIPPPFAPVATFTAMNWQIKPLQQTELSADRIRELNDFLQKQK